MDAVVDQIPLLTDEGPPVAYIEPPFQVNHPKYWHMPPEVSGSVILESMRRRLGWQSYTGKRLLDFGCGVRFARTIVNLGLEIGQYVGIEAQWPMVKWLRRNVADPRFEFHHLRASNPFYGLDGPSMAAVDALPVKGPFDVACLFSVVTHLDPEEAAKTFSLLRPVARRLYFTAALKPEVAGYAEEDPDHPRMYAKFNPGYMTSLVEAAGWRIEAAYAPSHYQEHVLVCG